MSFCEMIAVGRPCPSFKTTRCVPEAIKVATSKAVAVSDAVTMGFFKEKFMTARTVVPTSFWPAALRASKCWGRSAEGSSTGAVSEANWQRSGGQNQQYMTQSKVKDVHTRRTAEMSP
jgi:hypothetical protein